MEDNKEKIYYLNLEDILPNRFQPRLAFDEKELNNLSESIQKYGVIQPIVVRRISDKYEIIAGERRYKAACLAGLKTIPAILNNTDDNTSAEIALLENLQRKNLSVIEEAQSFKKLIDRGFTQEEIANKLGVSQSSIANKMRLLSLPKEVKDALLYNQISERHARSLLTLDNEDLQKNLLYKIINEKLTVRQTEEEINLLLLKDNVKQGEYVPEGVQRFLKPEEDKNIKEEKIEFLDIETPKEGETVIEDNNSIEKNTGIDDNLQTKIEPENINDLEKIPSNNEDINPFQMNNNDEKINTEAPIQSKIPEENSAYLYQELGLLIDSYSIGKNKIGIKKEELMDKYQIVIEINKY